MSGLRGVAANHPEMIREVRGKGLMIGVQFDSGDPFEVLTDASVSHEFRLVRVGTNGDVDAAKALAALTRLVEGGFDEGD